jgi:hypothetical protein
LLIIIWGLLQTEWGQNWLARQVTKKLSRDLQSKIEIKRVKIGFFNKMELEGVLVEDQRKDTLLYAGAVQVRITDWFFFKDKADLEYIGLEDAQVNFNRTDSVWNYAFLEKYFASSGSGQQQSGIEFNLKKVVLDNVRFVQKDAWVGSDMNVAVKYMNLDADEISLTKKTINVNSIDLTDPYFATLNYTGKRPKQVAIIDSIKNKAEQDWTVLVNTISIKNGTYRNDRNNLIATTSGFDGQHLNFNTISGTLKQLRFAKDTLTGSIDITAKERSGLLVKKLQTSLTIHPQAMIFDKLDLRINQSVLGNYFAMRYDEIGDMSDFISAVTMEANFKKASVSSDDIAFFAPKIKDWNRTIKIDGKVKGTVDALAAENLEVWAGNNTYINGNISLVGLPNINETLINIEASDLRTTYTDAVSFIPAVRNIKTPNLAKLSYLRFKGTYTGFINDFVTYGTLQTNLGTLVTDLNMKFPKSGEPVYSGKLSTADFQLGQFINSPKLGVIAFNGSVKGKGFKWQTLDMDIDGKVQRLQYDNYVYQNITTKGRLSNRLFSGDFDIKDPNADIELKGTIDLSRPKPLFDVVADIAHANLKQLQLTNEDLRLSGQFNLNIEGSSISDLIGDARISNATLLHNDKRLSFDSLIISSHYVDGLKNFRAVSNEFDANIVGDFDIDALPDAFTLFLNRYYPSYIKAPRFVKPQTFTFDITTGIVEDYIKLMDERLTGLNNSHLRGSLDTRTNNMTIDADVPYFAYKQYEFSDVQLRGSGDAQKLLLTGEVGNATIDTTYLFPQTSFNLSASNDVTDININTTANQPINQANVSAQVRTFDDGATILFNPSSFVLNGKTWSIEQGGELNFRKNTVVQGELVLRESNQEIILQTLPSTEGNSLNDLHITLRNLNLADISPLITNKNRIEGIASGKIIVEDPQKKFNISTENLRVDELRIDNDSLGAVELSGNYNNATGMITARGNNLDPDHKIKFDLAMDIKDPENVFIDRITVSPENFQVKILERFIGTLFSNLQGYVTGDLNIIGEGANRQYIGKGRLRDAGMKVNFSQVFYKIDDTEINLEKDRIDFGTMKLRDTLGNTATVRGNIKHNGFQNMVFDLEAKTDGKPMLLLNTTYRDNQMFYGNAMGTGSLVLTGPQHDMFMWIDVDASETHPSKIVLPPSQTRESGLANFMVERKYGREMNQDELRGSATNLSYEVNLTANPMVEMEVRLDEETGDAIRGKGSGNLVITSGTSSPLSLRGRYNIQEGDYLFTFQTFFKKPFILRKGANNYIEWTGDPYGATAHIEAVYTAEQVSFAPLATALGNLGNGSENLGTVRDNVDVVTTLTGNLFQPNFSFELQFPPNSVINRNPALQFGIQQLQRNPTELQKQVAFLIVSNSFAPYGTSTAGFNPVQEFTYSTISGLLFNEVNKFINQLLGKILRNNDVTFNLTGSLYDRNLINAASDGFELANQSNINFTFGKSFFQGRVIFNVGGTFDVPIQNDFNQTVNLLPDVTAEVLLNKSGSLRATFFYRENLDFLSGSAAASLREKRYGSSISYSRQFESLFGWLTGKKNRGKGILKAEAQKPSPDTTNSKAPDSTVVGKN